ncbi:MAG TPA: LLM class F420-dependent oxidoreductase [Candidatus Binatia bacterium]|nr:LLM class F420-dependent oxidoreductase [Candidatus Binatia bacterium]
MRFGLNVGYSGAKLSVDMSLVHEAERLGFHSVWTAEAYGSDAVTPLAWIGGQTSKIHLGSAIMQMPARTPAMTASTATSLDQLSGGRFLLGLGVSGPQVVEGWHGQRFGKPLVKTREYVSIVRKIWAREEPVVHRGEHYQIPYAGPDATGLGKPLRSILHGRQIPIYIAAIGPKSVEQTAEIADGWLPVWYTPYRTHVYKGTLDAGFGKAGGGKSLKTFDIAPTVMVLQGDDVQSCLDFVKPMLALYIGGMGARGKNFYNDLACRYGFEADAKKIQDLYLDGKKGEAAAAVPNQLADEVSLVGPAARIRDRLAPWRESGVTTMICGARQPEVLRTLAEAGG